jgi:hypothetical protein
MHIGHCKSAGLLLWGHGARNLKELFRPGVVQNKAGTLQGMIVGLGIPQG